LDLENQKEILESELNTATMLVNEFATISPVEIIEEYDEEKEKKWLRNRWSKKMNSNILLFTIGIFLKHLTCCL